MSEDVISPPRLLYKKPSNRRKKKRQSIVDLIGGSAAGLTRNELGAAVGSPIDSVSVMMHQINKELAGQGWKISSTLKRGPKRRGAPERRYRLVPMQPHC
jgi:hypothetical protein